jgi:hypothetical protein
VNTPRLSFFAKYGTPMAILAALALVLAIAPSKSPTAVNSFADSASAPTDAAASATTVPGATAAGTTSDAATSGTDATVAGGDTTAATVAGVAVARTSTGAGTTPTGTSGSTGGAATPTAGGAASTATTAAPRFGGATAASAGADCTRAKVFNSEDFGCKPAFSGDNGGATYTKGVSGDKIQAVFYVGNTGASLAEEPAASATVCGYPNPTPEQFDKTIEMFARFLNKNYQTYGRTVDFKVFRAQALSTDSAGTRAEAVKVDQQIKPFLLVNSFANEFVDETARRGIVNFGGVGLSGAFLKSHAPFVFQLGHDTDTGNELLAEYIGKRVHPYPSQWTGDDATQGPGKASGFSPPRGITRKYAIVYPGDAAQQLTTIGPDLASRMVKWGVPASQIRTYGYQSDATTWSAQSATLVAAMRNEGVTDVMFLVNPAFVSFFTLQATQQQWYPEYIITDFATQATSSTWRAIAGGPVVNGQNTYSQGKRAFGLNMAGAPSLTQAKCKSSPTEERAYAAFKWAAADAGQPGLEPASGFVSPFLGMWVSMPGIENAGPRIDPGTFRDGMWKIKVVPPVQRTDNLFGYGPGDYSGSQDAVEVWFNPTKNTRTAKDPPGEFEYVADGMRYTFGQFPRAKTEVFDLNCLGPGGCGTAPKWPGA